MNGTAHGRSASRAALRLAPEIEPGDQALAVPDLATVAVVPFAHERDRGLVLGNGADALPEISECALAVTAGSDAATVTAAEIWVAPASARPDTGPRRLRGL